MVLGNFWAGTLAFELELLVREFFEAVFSYNLRLNLNRSY